MVVCGPAVAVAASGWLSPGAMAVSPDGQSLYVACAGAGKVAVVDVSARHISSFISVPGTPAGLAVSPDGARLYVACAAPQSRVCVVNTATGEIRGSLAGGHTAMSPVLSPDGRTLYVCNRFNNEVSVFDLAAGKELRRIAVQREPVAADITKDGRYLLVANHLQSGRADRAEAGAMVSVIDTAAGKVARDLPLPAGSGSLEDLRVSPDGRYAVVTHLVARFNRLPTRVTGGWMHLNAMTVIELGSMRVRNTVVLDDAYSGAANPWGVAWSADSRTLVVAHAGTHELSVIDFPDLLARLALPPPPDPVNGVEPGAPPPETEAGYLPFFAGARRRLKLPAGDLGPRAVAIARQTICVGNYFSDTLTFVPVPGASGEGPAADGRTLAGLPSRLAMQSIPLGPSPEMTLARKGELCFHDARLCYDGWQSCSSCHPGGARADALNWDLLNDGAGNPKNTRSLLLAFQTPPAMSLGVRETADDAVRAGIEHILFTRQPEDVVAALEAYIKSLRPVPSPLLAGGKLPGSARRGQRVFVKAGCIACHPPPLYTDLHAHDVGTRSPRDNPADRFDTPTLVEVWRTAPYLHDGSATTIREAVTTRNLKDQHGRTSGLTAREIQDLCAYVLSR